MAFDEFKEHLEFREEKDDKRQIHYFYARLQAQAKRGIASEIFDRDQEGIRAYMHNELACMIWDLCMQISGPTYTVDDLRKAHEMGQCGCSFDYALKAVESGKGRA